MNTLFRIPVLDKWLVYAPLAREVALTNRSTIDALAGTNDGLLPSCLQKLKRRLLDRSSKPAGLPEDEIRPLFLGIIPTRGCNIGCVYCNFAGPFSPRTQMDPNIAIASVNWMAKFLAEHDQKRFKIHFFGGEPLIAQEIVDVVVHRARMMADRYGLDLYLDASTNGVCSDAMCQFIGDYFGGIVLSLDGPATIHNRNRPASNGHGTFERVDRTARILSKAPVDLCIRVCITHESVDLMESITRWICETYSPSVINFESLTPVADASSAGLRTPDPYTFARHCHASHHIANDLGVTAVYSAADFGTPRNSFCPVGNDTLIVDHDGRINACYLLPEEWEKHGLDLEVGQVGSDGTVNIDLDAIRSVRSLTTVKPRCEHCFCQWSCAGGCHVNHTYPGSSPTYSDFCIQTRLLTAALLLDEMNEGSQCDRLFADADAMSRLSLQDSDTFHCRDMEITPSLTAACNPLHSAPFSTE